MSIKTKPKAPASKQVKASPNRQQQLVRLLNRKSGASIAQMQEAFGWQPHTARAAISTLRKAGTVVERADTDKGSIYRIAGEG
jgi:predicted ArsR family transcriptional regulator